MNTYYVNFEYNNEGKLIYVKANNVKEVISKIREAYPDITLWNAISIDLLNCDILNTVSVSDCAVYNILSLEKDENDHEFVKDSIIGLTSIDEVNDILPESTVRFSLYTDKASILI